MEFLVGNVKLDSYSDAEFFAEKKLKKLLYIKEIINKHPMNDNFNPENIRFASTEGRRVGSLYYENGSRIRMLHEAGPAVEEKRLRPGEVHIQTLVPPGKEEEVRSLVHTIHHPPASDPETMRIQKKYALDRLQGLLEKAYEVDRLAELALDHSCIGKEGVLLEVSVMENIHDEEDVTNLHLSRGNPVEFEAKLSPFEGKILYCAAKEAGEKIKEARDKKAAVAEENMTFFRTIRMLPGLDQMRIHTELFFPGKDVMNSDRIRSL